MSTRKKASKRKNVKEDRIIRDSAFARRLEEASEAHGGVPAKHQGRYGWFVDNFRRRFNTKVSEESVRKWFFGEARPRPDKMRMLATLLNVDHPHLSLGEASEIAPREQKARSATVSGAVNVLAGFIEMAGGHPSFPEKGGPLPDCTDVSAIIKGATYAFRVSLAQSLGDRVYKFTVPADHAGCFVLGVVPGKGFSVEFLELSPELIEKHGANKGGFIEVSVARQGTGAYTTGRDQWRRIERFSERL